jgi:hypothetical protein
MRRRAWIQFTLSLALVLAPSLEAQQQGAAVVGTWSLELEVNGQAVPSQLSLWEEEGSLRGWWSGPRGSSDVDRVQFTDGTLSFVRAVSVQGQSFEMSFSGAVDGETLGGTLTTPRGEMPVSGRRISTQPAAAGGQAALESSGTEDDGDGEGGDEPLATSELPASEARELLGSWALQMSFQGNPVQMDLELADRDGKLAALLVTPQGEQAITDIERTDDGLELRLDSGIGRLVMLARLDGDRIAGTVGDAAGSFSTEFSGARAAVGEAGDRARRARMRSGRPLALLVVSEGEIKVYYADPSADGEEIAQVAAAGEGSVVQFPHHGAIKLMTDVDLTFAGATAPHGNVSPSYPGVYSLWLKKGADEKWRLVLNDQADTWGTMHDGAHDVGETPLELTTVETPAASLTVELEEREGGGELILSWGSYRWSAPFTAAAPDSAATAQKSSR